jgi:O-antigen ligase
LSAGGARRRLLVVLGSLYAVPLCLAWSVALAHLALGAAALAALVLGVRYRTWILRRTPADPALLGFAASWVLAAALAVDRAGSIVPLKKLLLLPILHLGAAVFATGSRARNALRLFVGGIAMTALVVLLQFLLVPHPSTDRLRGLTHYMTFSGLLALALPLAAAGCAGARGRARLAYATALAVLAVSLVVGMTRSAWLGSVAAAAAMLARARPRWALAAPVAAGLVFLVLPSAYRARAVSSFDLAHPDNVERLRLWRAGLDMWRDHPWTGVGLMDLKPLVIQYERAGSGPVHGHLHDNWIQIAATTGVIGLVAYGWLMVALGALAWRAGSAAPDRESRALGLGVWGAFVAFQVAGLFEWNFGDVEITIALYFLAASALASAARWDSGSGNAAPDGAFQQHAAGVGRRE